MVKVRLRPIRGFMAVTGGVAPRQWAGGKAERRALIYGPLWNYDFKKKPP
jgi:hypothetical protein